MRVALVDVNCKFSSTGKIVYDLFEQINKNGNEAIVCYGRGEEINEDGIYKTSIDLETYSHVALSRVTGIFGIFSPFSTKRLIDKLKAFKPDIVHLHELHGYYINYAQVVNYLKKENIKTIWTFHCEFMYTGKCGQAFDCDGFKRGCGDCPYLQEYPKSIFFDWTKQMFNKKKELFKDFDNLTITTPSKWLNSRIQESFLSDKNRVVINNGIDNTNVFMPKNTDELKQKHNINNEKVLLAVAPNLMSKQKGGEYIVELAKFYQGSNIKFILIGVDNLDRDYGSNVIALSRTKNQNMLAKYYTLADLLVICSSYENFPTTALEALSCGTNIVGFDSGGTKETAPDNYGAFVEYGNLKALKELIDSVFSGDLLLKNSKDCINFARERYSKENMVKEYQTLYYNKV